MTRVIPKAAPTLDKTTFNRWMTVMEDRVGRALMAPTKAAYFAVLREELTTEEFDAGMVHIFKTARYMPSPQEIVDASRGGTFDEQARAQWDEIVGRAARGETPLTPEGSELRAVLNAVGGAEMVRNPPDGYALRRAEDGFTRRWAHHLWSKSREHALEASAHVLELMPHFDAPQLPSGSAALPATRAAAPASAGRRK